MKKSVKILIICTVLLSGCFLFPVNGRSENITLLEFDSKIVGYRVNTAVEDVILYDDNAGIDFSNDKGFHVTIKSDLGDYQCGELVIEEETYGNFDKYRRYEIENIQKGFFMEIGIDEEFSHFSIAYDDKVSQFCFEGILWQGFDEFFGKSGKNEATTEENKLIDEGLMKIHQDQKDNLKITISEKFKHASKSYPITYTAYGVVHMPFDLDDDHGTSYSHYVDDVCDDYMEPESAIDIGIYRYMPNEATIKSDLQYYNKDAYDLIRYSHDILAYLILTENSDSSNHDWKIWKWRWFFGWNQVVDSTLTAAEISNLWYSYYDPDPGDPDIFVFPSNMIIFAHMCYSYGTTIANAFLNDGANAFVCSLFKAFAYSPETSSDPARVFWEGLCDNNDTVGNAAIDYEDELENQLPGETHSWSVLGNRSAVLAN